MIGHCGVWRAAVLAGAFAFAGLEAVSAEPLTLVTGQTVELLESGLIPDRDTGIQILGFGIDFPEGVKSFAARTAVTDELFEEVVGPLAHGGGLMGAVVAAPAYGSDPEGPNPRFEVWAYARQADHIWTRMTDPEIPVGPSLINPLTEGVPRTISNGASVLFENEYVGRSPLYEQASLYAFFHSPVPIGNDQALAAYGIIVVTTFAEKSLAAAGLRTGHMMVFERAKRSRFDFRRGFMVSIDLDKGSGKGGQTAELGEAVDLVSFAAERDLKVPHGVSVHVRDAVPSALVAPVSQASLFREAPLAPRIGEAARDIVRMHAQE
ncbi:MAG: hypothetical protein H6923_04345 [Alphaproteobacteria bacterium]|nr:hypothetical protein [Alphaproteobacteria bacterium]